MSDTLKQLGEVHMLQFLKMSQVDFLKDCEALSQFSANELKEVIGDLVARERYSLKAVTMDPEELYDFVLYIFKFEGD